MPPLLAVPNVSEGRDAELIARLGEAFAVSARLLDTHADPDHNRSVFTLSGEVGVLGDSLLSGARAAIEAIDMTTHEGRHPCVGALDVCPVVWHAAELRERAHAEAGRVARLLAGELDLPVLVYGDMAATAERRERSHFRRGGLPELARRMEAGELSPDLGPAHPHPTAGAVLVTARPPLVAFNLELDTGDVDVAHEVASLLRESGGGLPGVRAIGLPLAGGRAQLSCNVHDPFAVPLARLVREVRRLGAARGVDPVAAELVGLAPAAAFEGFPADLPIPGFDSDRHLIENRL